MAGNTPKKGGDTQNNQFAFHRFIGRVPSGQTPVLRTPFKEPFMMPHRRSCHSPFLPLSLIHILAEAWYLNNQFILDETMTRFPKLMNVNFNAPDINGIKDDPDFAIKSRKKSAGWIQRL